MNPSSGREAISGMAISDTGENMGITDVFENLYERNITLYTFIAIDETRNNYPGNVGELSGPGTHFD